MQPNSGVKVPLAWIFRGRAYLMGVMTGNVQPIYPVRRNILKSSKSREWGLTSQSIQVLREKPSWSNSYMKLERKRQKVKEKNTRS
ncbi:hypothetical protein PoB_002216900 [Plakobranchus ocellatus]|uniref:Uncharacterized protein n=1 Tax=Plakobranchus ocellatus TaxID=259542 RepID=A0AAV3ZP44_9GAST|nr:hypothetical protein PoB_002216900 [Plakobranchus ocellatus]